jgi:hypothetical protein
METILRAAAQFSLRPCPQPTLTVNAAADKKSPYNFAVKTIINRLYRSPALC